MTQGAGWEPGLTEKTEAWGSGGSEARNTTRLQGVPEREEAHSSGRLLGKKLGQLQEIHGSVAGLSDSINREGKKKVKQRLNFSLLPQIRTREGPFLPGTRAEL